MRNAVRTALFGVAAMTTLLATGPAHADHVSIGLGLSNGHGNYFSLGVNTRPQPCYVPRPVVVAPAPVVYAQPAQVVYAQPAPVVYAPPAPVVYAQPAPVVYAQPSGYWVETANTVWIEGIWVDCFDAWGHHGRRQQPGHWETHHGREWRPGPGGDHGGPRRDGFGGGHRDQGPRPGGFGGGRR